MRCLQNPVGLINPPLGALFGMTSYAHRVMAWFGAALIAYWQMDETSGSTAGDSSPQGHDGIYSGVTLANMPLPGKIGGSGPRFDGANDYVSVYSAGFDSAFDGQVGSAMVWAKVYDASVWTDGVYRHCFNFFVDASNRVHIRKSGGAGNNQMEVWYKAAGVQETIYATSLTSTDWVHYAVTWSNVADEVKFFVNGVQAGGTQTGLGSWTGNLSAANTKIGAYDASQLSWNGWLGHVVVLNRVATPAEIAAVHAWGV